jgi:hypothetical protein
MLARPARTSLSSSGGEGRGEEANIIADTNVSPHAAVGTREEDNSNLKPREQKTKSLFVCFVYFVVPTSSFTP